MLPILISKIEATDYGYDIESICYLSHYIPTENDKIKYWREGIAFPDVNENDELTSWWRVELYHDGEKQFLSSAISLSDAKLIIHDWTIPMTTDH